MASLHEEQQYVSEIASRRQIPLEFVLHPRETQTALEKAALLGWEPQRVIKAVYFSNGATRVGVIMPDRRKRIDTKALFSEVLEVPGVPGQRLSGKQAGKFGINGGVPRGMSAGTSSPFPYKSLVGAGRDISKLIVFDDPELTGVFSDVSIGIHGDGARMSLQLPYEGIATILIEQFGEYAVTTAPRYLG